MLKHDQVPIISSSLDYRSEFNFHHQWLRCKKLFRLCLASSISHVKNQRSMFFGFSSYGTKFPGFWTILNDFKRYEIVCWVTPNLSAKVLFAFDTNLHPSNNASNSASSYTFGLPLRSLSLTSNSPFLNFWNHSRQLLSFKTAWLYASTTNLWASAADFFKLKK